MFEILSTSSMKHEVQACLRGRAIVQRSVPLRPPPSLRYSHVSVIYLKVQHEQEAAGHQRNPDVVLVLSFSKECGLTWAPTQL